MIPRKLVDRILLVFIAGLLLFVLIYAVAFHVAARAEHPLLTNAATIVCNPTLPARTKRDGRNMT